MSDNTINRRLSGYQKLKSENEKLKQDIYNLVRNADKAEGIHTKIKYEMQYKMSDTVWLADDIKSPTQFSGILGCMSNGLTLDSKTDVASSKVLVRRKRGYLRVGKTKYKYVSKFLVDGKDIMYRACIQKFNYVSYHKDEKKAAIAIDIFLASKGLQPVNVLKSKKD